MCSVQSSSIDHQHPRVGVGQHRLARDAQRRDRRRTAHEADQRALHVLPQPEALRELQVEPRRREAGAGADDQMRHPPHLRGCREGRDRARGECQRLGLIERHPGRGAGECAAAVEAGVVDLAGSHVAGAQRREAVRDPGALGHAHEQPPVARRKQGLRELGEERMDVVIGDRRADPIEVGPRQFVSFAAGAARLEGGG